MDSDLDKYKIRALLTEYREIRSETRTYETLQVICIFLSILTFGVFFIIGVISNQYILVFVAPSFSIFFVLVGMAMLAYTTQLGLRGSNIEGQLKKILGESTIQWEYTIGTFRSVGGNILNSRVGRYWVKISILAILAGVSPIVIGLFYGFDSLYSTLGYIAWMLIGFYMALGALTCFIGYRFYTRDWEKLKLEVY